MGKYIPGRLKKRVLIPLFILFSLIVIIIGYQYYKITEENLKKEQFQDLKVIAELKINQIVQWRNERIIDATLLSKNPLFRISVRKFYEEKNLDEKRHIKQIFNIVKNYGNYESVYLTDSKGKVILSTDTLIKNIDTAFIEDLNKANSEKNIILTDFKLCGVHSNVHLLTISPILADNKRVVAFLILQSEPKLFLYPLLQTWPTDSETGETLLFKKTDKEVIFLNELRHKSGTALKFKIPLTETEIMAVQGALGKRGFAEGKDYRGEDVIAYISEIEGSPWLMVSKIDKNEIFKESKQRALFITIIASLIILFTATVTAFMYKFRQKEITIKLMESEKELWKTQEEYRTILYSIGDAVITTDIEGKITLMNKIAEDITGWKEEEAKGKELEEVFNIINEETRKPVENPVKRILRDGIIIGLANHTILISRDGKEYPIADAGAPVKDDSDNIIGVVLVFRDQTKEREKERELIESEEKFRTVFEASNAGKLIAYSSGEIYPNKAFCDMLGYTKEEMIGKKVAEITHPDDLENNLEIINKLFRGEIDSARYTKRYIHKNGTPIWADVHSAIFKDINNNPQYIIANIIDITEIKKREEELELNNIRQKALLKLHNMRDKNEEEIFEYCIEATVNSLKSQYAFFGLINEDETVMKIHSWSRDVMKECKVKKEPIDFILSQSGIWSDCVRLRKPIVINDYASYKDKKGIPEGHVEIKRFISVPVFEGSKIVAVAVVANKKEDYTQSDVNAFLTFMNRMWEIISYNRTQKEYINLLLKNQAILDSAADIIMELDTNKVYIWSNQTGYEFFGEDVIGKEASYYFIDEQDTYEKLRKIFEGSDEIVQLESWQSRRDGAKRLLSWRCKALKDNEGKVIGAISLARDITEEKEINNKLKESEERFRTLFDTMEQGVVYQDSKGKIILTNQATEKILGLTMEQMLGRTSYDPRWKAIKEDGSDYPGDEHPAMIALHKGIKATGIMGVFNPKDNQHHWILINSIPEFKNNDTKPFQVCTTFTDITELKNTQNKLKQSIDNWYLSFNAINDGLVILDEKQHIIQCNEAFLNLIGKTSEEILGNFCHHIVHSTDSPIEECPFVKMTKSKKRESMEMNINEMICNVVVDPILDKNNVIIGAVHIITDITKIKQTEKELIGAKERAEEMNKLKSHFLANISHELRTPMVSILGFSEILTKKIEDEALRKNAELVYKGANRLMATLNNILDISLIESGQMPIDITDVDIVNEANETVNFYKESANKKNLYLEFSSEFESLYLKLDKKFIQEIFDNLINNAIKYTNEGGIYVSIKKVVVDNKPYIDIDIKDTGIGIEENKRDIIWDEFRQASEGYGRSFEGTGLGLSISKKLASLLKGEIFVKESEVGKGSTFTFRIPLDEKFLSKEADITKIKEREELIESMIDFQPEGELPEILYVEDEEDSIILVKNMVEKFCKLDIAYSGEEALEKVKLKKYPAILMDINLRKGLDGIQVTELIRKIPGYEHIPIVAITAFAMVHEREEFLRRGCSHYLSKPFTKDDLISLIKEILFH
ncbi:MAG: PAS domain S-box protein [Ignavibacteria bacterium]|nr:PAS domain S-box protein [Ignavibacteria bacterium]